MTKEKKKKEILFTHDAWWFLHYHPAFRLPFRFVKSNLENMHGKKVSSYIEEHMSDGKFWVYQETHLFRRALEENLSIYYARVNNKGTIGKNKSKNINTECWLEFGPMEYYIDYLRKYDSKEKPEKWMLDHINHSHDWNLDCGAPTFDEALVKLANLVLEKYGDYVEDNDGRDSCGGEKECKDCIYTEAFIKKMGSGKV